MVDTIFEKSPMDYFFSQDFNVNSMGSQISPAERLFMKKYMGIDTFDEKTFADNAFVVDNFFASGNEFEKAGKNYVEKLLTDFQAPDLQKDGLQEKEKAEVLATVEANEEKVIAKPAEVKEVNTILSPASVELEEGKKPVLSQSIEDLDFLDIEEVSILKELKTAEEILMVGLYLNEQIFVIPVKTVHEVIPFMPLTRVPRAPDFLLGVINLRDHITPIIRLTEFVSSHHSLECKESGFFVICQYGGLQIGLYIDKVHTMYKAKQADISWDVDNQLGAAAEFISGLFIENEKLFGIISVENIVKKLLASD